MGQGATTDPQRLLRVAEMLAEAASARDAGQRRRLPVVQAADAAGLVAIMHAQLDEAIAIRDSEAAAAGIVIACHRGCHACCNLPVNTGEHEAVAIAVWLQQPENAAVKARFLANYPAWRERLGDRIERMSLAVSPELEVLAQEYFVQQARCPFNDEDGACTVYPVRPGVCRTAHAIGTNEHCQSFSTSTVQTTKHVIVDHTVEEQRALRCALHETQRQGPSELLPKAVMRQLAKATAFPNSPCPCGSGAKYKRCCGV